MAKKKPKEFDACEVAKEITDAANKAVKDLDTDQAIDVLENVVADLQIQIEALQSDGGEDDDNE